MKLPFFNESLNAFLAVAAERSFSAAAKKLGVTQSAVTKAVARLEKELAKGGVTLVYAAKDSVHSNAVVLKEYLGERLKEGGAR